MTEQISEEQLEKEADAVIIQLGRDQRKSSFKFGALMILVFIAVFAIIYITALVPSTVMAIMGQ